MTFTTDQDAFLADFGVSVTGPSSVVFTGILDSPDQIFGDDMRIVSTEYELTYKTSAITLTHDAQLTIAAATYKVREVLKTADGAFSKALLSKV